LSPHTPPGAECHAVHREVDRPLGVTADYAFPEEVDVPAFVLYIVADTE
jgi:hypothetical protein